MRNFSPVLMILFAVLLAGIDWTSRTEAAETIIGVDRCSEQALVSTVQRVRELRADGNLDPIIIELPPGRIEISETLTLDSPIVGRGLTLKATESQKTTLSGSVTLSQVHRDDEGNWRYGLPEGWRGSGVPRVVTVNGALSTAARTPNAGEFRIEKSLPDRRSGFTAQPGDLPQSLELTDTVFDLVLLHDWSSSRLPVASYDSASRILKTVGPIGCSAAHYAIDHFEKQPRYWLEGHPSFADQPGEWYIDQPNEQLVLRASAQQTAPPTVELPRLTKIIEAVGTDETPLTGFRLEGLTFTGAQFSMPPGGLAGAQATMSEPRDAEGNRTTSNRPLLGAAVNIERGENCRVQNCRFESLGGTGLWLGQQTNNSVVFRCQFTDLGGNGLNLGEDNSRRVDGQPWYSARPSQLPTGNRVEQCRFQFCGQILPGAVGIWAPLNRDLKIVNNHLHDLPYTGISLGWMWNPQVTGAGNNQILNNRIEFVMQRLSDGAGIYTLGHQPDTLIADNIITDVPLNAGRAESNGIFCDEGTTGLTVHGNTIRRIDRSPLRFHKAGKNLVEANRWDLATSNTPPVRFNNTPPGNITIQDNEVLPAQTKIFLIGNSLTWDTVPSKLDEAVHWHVDCGKPLTYIRDNPQQPCVKTSRNWPVALTTMQYDFVSVQPHYGTELADDLAVISQWMQLQPEAVFVIHTGWARSASFAAEYSDTDPAGPLTHSSAYFDELLKQLQGKFPEREFRTTDAMHLLKQIEADISAGTAPFENLTDIYRDAIHMHTGPGRYLMHNQMRKTLGQPRLETGFSDFSPNVKAYLDGLLDQ